jgi:MinD-like ATPase involved in chromosome partitioning or flagellar assembly
VTTTEDAALLDTYAAIKQGAQDSILSEMRVLMNQCDSERTATALCRRLSAACERFLSRAVPALPALPRHGEPKLVGEPAMPRVWDVPNSPFGHAMLWLGKSVTDLMQLDDCHDVMWHRPQHTAKGVIYS